MARKNIAQLSSSFETGDIPQGSDYADIFESNFNLEESSSLASGSLELIGDVTASYFTGSFVGDGSQLYNLPSDSEWYDGGTFITSSKYVEITGSLSVSGSNSAWNITGGGSTLKYGLRTFDSGIRTEGSIFISHVSSGGETARLFLGTANEGMDLVRLNDSTLVLGGVTQNYGWRIFGIKHGLNGTTYTTEIDNLIATGSMMVSGSIDIGLKSGSAFTITEDDIDQENRLTFTYDQGDPTLIIAGRSAESSLHLKYNLAGDGLKLTNQGLFRRSVLGTNYDLSLNINAFQPLSNQLDLGYYNARWKSLYLYSGNKISWGTVLNDDLVSLRHTAATNTLVMSGSSDVSLDIKGNVTASYYTGSFVGDGSQLTNLPGGAASSGTTGMVQLSDGAGGFDNSNEFYYDNTGGFVVGDGFGTIFISQSIASGFYLTLGDANDTNGPTKIRIPNGGTSEPIEVTGSLDILGNITSSGTISASGDLFARDGRFSRDGGAAEIEILASEIAGGIVGTQTSDNLIFRRFNIPKFTISESRNFSQQDFDVQGDISASGDITLGHTTNYTGYVAGTTPYMFTNQSYASSGGYSLGFLIATGSTIGGTAVKISGSSDGSFVGIGVPYTTPLTKALTVEGDISASGDLYIGTGKIYGNEAYNNYLTFNDSSSLFKVQGETYIKFDGNSPKQVTINEGTNNIDFVVKGLSVNPLFKTDANTGKIGMHGVGTPTAGLHIADDLWVSGLNGNITASANISASGYISSSFFVGDGSQLTNLPGGGSSEWYNGGTYITSSKDVEITGSLDVIGSSTLAGNNIIGINGAGSTHTIYGTTTFTDAIQGNFNLQINGNTTLGNASSDKINIFGDATITGSLVVSSSGGNKPIITNDYVGIGDPFLEGSTINAQLHISGSGTQTSTIESSDSNSSLRLIANGSGHAFIDMEEGPNQRWIAGMYTSDNSYRIASGSAFASTTLFELDQTGEISARSITLSETGSIAYLEPTETFINYITFCHNFVANGGNVEFNVPWSDSTEGLSSSTTTKAAFQVPYSMSLHKLVFSLEDINGTDQDVYFELQNQPNGDDGSGVTIEATSSIVNVTTDQIAHTLNSSDFNASPVFTYPDKIRLHITSSNNFENDDIYITTIWRQEIKI